MSTKQPEFLNSNTGITDADVAASELLRLSVENHALQARLAAYEAGTASACARSAISAADKLATDNDKLHDEITTLRTQLEAVGVEPMRKLAVAHSTQDRAVERDELLQAAINFIQALTGMTPPPIEVAPPEVFAPFRAFVEKIQEITDRRCAASAEPQAKPAAPAQADEYPDLPEWSKRDDLGGLVPSEVRQALRKYVDADRAASSVYSRSMGLVRVFWQQHTESDALSMTMAELHNDVELVIRAARGAAQAAECGNCFEGETDRGHDCRKCGGTGAAQPAAQAAPVDATAQQDAERYHGLRARACMGYPSGEGSDSKDAYLVITGYGYDDNASVVDAAVDATRAAQGEK